MNSLSSYKRENGEPFLFFEETTSTMEEAKAAIDHGYGEDLLVCANFQSRGRGRIAGRKWNSGKGMNLLFSWVVSSSTVKGTLPLSLQVGYGLFSFLNSRFSFSKTSLSSFDFNCRIKWPNDIYLNNRKLSGVVCETYKSLYIIGIGINCNQLDFPDELRSKATSLAMELKGFSEIKRSEILKGVIDTLKEIFRQGVKPFEIESALMGLGEEVKYIEGDPQRNPVQSGILKGINRDGSLRLSSKEGERSLYSGELIF